jgi:hypothetical protein
LRPDAHVVLLCPGRYTGCPTGFRLFGFYRHELIPPTSTCAVGADGTPTPTGAADGIDGPAVGALTDTARRRASFVFMRHGQTGHSTERE